jgi:hypothetical protein
MSSLLSSPQQLSSPLNPGSSQVVETDLAEKTSLDRGKGGLCCCRKSQTVIKRCGAYSQRVVVEIPRAFWCSKNGGWTDAATAFVTLHRSTETWDKLPRSVWRVPSRRSRQGATEETAAEKERKLTSYRGKEDMSHLIVCTLAARQHPTFFSSLPPLARLQRPVFFSSVKVDSHSSFNGVKAACHDSGILYFFPCCCICVSMDS